MLPIVEKFCSLQGEGQEAGTPSIFIRVGGCTLACPWCDTKYASRDSYKAKWKLDGEKDVASFVELVATAPPDEVPVTHAVITGGEPMMREYWEDIQQMIYLLWFNYKIDTTLETTACVDPDDINMPDDKNFLNNIQEFVFSFMDRFEIDEYPTFIKFSVSPKMQDECYKVDITIPILDFYAPLKCAVEIIDMHKLLKNIFMKVVYQKVPYIKEHIEYLKRSWPPELRAKHFCIMPYTPMNPKEYLGKTFEQAYKESCIQTAKFCKERNIHYSPRLHIDLWGLKRGV